MADDPCARCKAATPTNDNNLQTTFWGAFGTRTETRRFLRVAGHYCRRKPRFGGSTNLTSDETKALCEDCWSLLIGRFLQGRSIDAMPGKGCDR